MVTCCVGVIQKSLDFLKSTVSCICRYPWDRMGHTLQMNLTGEYWTGSVLRTELAEWRAETGEVVAVLLEQLASCSRVCLA